MLSPHERTLRAKLGALLDEPAATSVEGHANAIASLSVDLVELLFTELLKIPKGASHLAGTCAASRLACTCKFAASTLRVLKNLRLEIAARALTATPSSSCHLPFFDGLMRQEKSRIQVRVLETALQGLVTHCAGKHCQYAQKSHNALMKKRAHRSGLPLIAHALQGAVPKVRVAWDGLLDFAVSPKRGAAAVCRSDGQLVVNWLENAPQHAHLAHTELRISTTRPMGTIPETVRALAMSACGHYVVVVSTPCSCRDGFSGGIFQGDAHVDVRVIGRDGSVVSTTLSDVTVLNVWFAASLLCVSTLTAKPTPAWAGLGDWVYDTATPFGEVEVRRFRLESLAEEPVANPLSAWSGSGKTSKFMSMSHDQLQVVTAAVVPVSCQEKNTTTRVAMSTVSLFDTSASKTKQQLYVKQVMLCKQVARDVLICGQSLVIAVSHEAAVKIHVLRKGRRGKFDHKFVVDLPTQTTDWVWFKTAVPSPCGRFALFVIHGPKDGLVLLDVENDAKLTFSSFIKELSPFGVVWNLDGLWHGLVQDFFRNSPQHTISGLLLHGVV